MRDGLLFLHILGVAGWLGGGLHGLVAYTAVASTAPEVAGPAMRALTRLDARYYGPSTLLVLLSGIGLVLTSDAYEWGDTFVIIGLVAFVIAAALGAALGKRSSDRLVEAVATEGPGRADAVRRWRRSTVLDFLVLLVTLWAMISKIGA
jgi:hypothetical protein